MKKEILMVFGFVLPEPLLIKGCNNDCETKKG
jgi:hypothetical protein